MKVMAKHMKKFFVSSFRGLKDLSVENTSDINILVGDNNSGKTSVLEALMLLRNPNSFSNVINVARLRETRNFYLPFRVSTYEAFVNLFNRNTKSEKMMLQVMGEVDNTLLDITINGNVENVMVDLEEVAKSNPKMKQRITYGEVIDNSETPMFIGKQHSIINGSEDIQEIKFSNYSSITGSRIDRPIVVDFDYVSPIDHSGGRIFSKIIKNDNYKHLVIKVLQTFDKDIVDLVLLKNEQSNAPVEYINHNQLGLMPVSTYGDGIKKVILLADRIASAQGGVLLIDEIETAIHIRSYKDIFNFVVKACIEFKVQLFATTHNIEALDSILKTQYNEKTEEYDSAQKDLIRVITFRKEEKTGKTLSRVLTGEKVFQNRENFDFEVRV